METVTASLEIVMTFPLTRGTGGDLTDIGKETTALFASAILSLTASAAPFRALATAALSMVFFGASAAALLH